MYIHHNAVLFPSSFFIRTSICFPLPYTNHSFRPFHYVFISTCTFAMLLLSFLLFSLFAFALNYFKCFLLFSLFLSVFWPIMLSLICFLSSFNFSVSRIIIDPGIHLLSCVCENNNQKQLCVFFEQGDKKS